MNKSIQRPPTVCGGSPPQTVVWYDILCACSSSAPALTRSARASRILFSHDRSVSFERMRTNRRSVSPIRVFFTDDTTPKERA